MRLRCDIASALTYRSNDPGGDTLSLSELPKNAPGGSSAGTLSSSDSTSRAATRAAVSPPCIDPASPVNRWSMCLACPTRAYAC